MAETFSFERDGRRYIVFLRFDVDDLPGFARFLEQRLGVEIGPTEKIGGFAETSAFRFRGFDYTAVAGDQDDCHVVAPNDAGRTALIEAIFGAGATGDPWNHPVSGDV